MNEITQTTEYSYLLKEGIEPPEFDSSIDFAANSGPFDPNKNYGAWIKFEFSSPNKYEKQLNFLKAMLMYIPFFELGKIKFISHILDDEIVTLGWKYRPNHWSEL